MSIDWNDYSGRGDPRQRWRIYRVADGGEPELLATAESPQGVGVAIVTLGSEGEFDDYACGVLDSMPECEDCGGNGWDLGRADGGYRKIGCHTCKSTGVKPTGTWTLRPWCASPREISAAARVLRTARK